MTSLSYIVGRGCCIVVSVLDVKIRRYCSSIGMIGGCTLDCPWKGNCSTCDDSGNASSDAGASREDSIVFLLNGVTFQLLLVGLLLDIMDYELGLRVIYAVRVLQIRPTKNSVQSWSKGQGVSIRFAQKVYPEPSARG